MMISRFLSFFAIPIAVLLSCAPHPANQDGSSNTSADSSAAPNGEEEGTPSAQQIPPNGSNVSLSLKRPGFRFEPPDPNWALVSDPSNDLAPLEFYNTVTGLRATLSTETLVEDQSAQIADRAQAELQSRSSGNQKNIYAELHPMKLGVALSGVGWEEAGLQDGKNRQSTGMAALLGNQVFVLSLSASDSLHSQTDFLKRFQAFFAGLKIDSALIQEQGPAVGERVQQYQSTALDYQWSSSDTIWHRWTSLDALNTDPDLTLTDTNGEISLFTYGAYIDPQEVSSRDLFRVFLVRLGLNAEAQDLQVHKKGSGEAYTQDFETVHSEGEKRIHYRGRFFYEKGRALLIAVWTQDSLYKTYRPIMERALKGLKPSPLPSTGLPDQQRLRQINARIINQVGLLRLAEDQPLVALSYFEKANRMDPSEPLYLINCGFVYQLRNLYGPGTDHYQSQMALVQKSGKLLSILGEMYEALHDYNRALEYYEMALRFTPNDPELVINQSDALWGIGQRNQSLEVVQNLYRKQPSARLGVYVAKTLMGLDQYAEAVDLLYSLQKKFSLTRDMGLALIEALTFLQRHQEALAISDQLLPLAPENFEVWNARGKTQFHLKQFRAAEVSLQHALKIKSDDEDAKSFLSATKAFLGKADIRALQAPIEPVLARPKNLKFLVAPGLVDSAKSGDFPAVVHWQEEVLKAGRNTPWVRTEAQLLQILDPRGAGLFQEFTFTFLPGVDRIFINALEVYDSNWKLKNRWTVKEAYITYLSDKGSGDEAQMAHLPLTDLRPGDYVFLEVSRTSIENTGTLPYVNHVCSREIPVGRDEFKLLADTLGILSEEYGPIERQAINGGLLWSIDWPVVVRKEVYMPIYRDFGAGVLVASKQSWQQVGKDYQTLIQHQFKSSIPVREKAFEVLGSQLPNQEAIFHMADWVRDNIRYRDVAFGGHSLIPQLALQTINSRQGDCKDQSLLLQEMLTTIGVPSKLALVNLEDPGSESLPTIQQFNHMILFVPAGQNWPELWIDPTDKAASRRPIPLDLEGKVSLVIHGDSSYITVTPILEKDQEHRANLNHSLFLDSSGHAEFRDSLTLYGMFASAIRAEMLARDSKERQRYFTDWLTQAIPDAKLSSLQVENVLEFTKPLILVLTFTSDHYFAQTPSHIQAPYPNLWERSFLRLPKVAHRHHPLRLPHETQFNWSLQVRGPQGAKVQLQSSNLSLEKLNYVQIDQAPQFQASRATLRWRTLATYADASEYNAIRREWNAVLNTTAPIVVLEK